MLKKNLPQYLNKTTKVFKKKTKYNYSEWIGTIIVGTTGIMGTKCNTKHQSYVNNKPVIIIIICFLYNLECNRWISHNRLVWDQARKNI